MVDNFYDKIFISDTHLSSKACNHKNLKDFLSTFYTPVFYLVGDLFDLWKLKIIDSWPDEHTKILSEFIQILQDQTEVKYIVGNHDEFFENFVGSFSNLTFAEKDVITINGKKLLVTHGHQFDDAIKYLGWLGAIGTGIAEFFRSKKESTFSLSEYLEKNPNKISKFEEIILKDVKKKGLDGVICGHTHKPNLAVKNNLIYANTGDFVTNSSFIAQKDNKLILMAYENDQVVIVQELEV